jgi:hypothetical protein
VLNSAEQCANTECRIGGLNWQNVTSTTACLGCEWLFGDADEIGLSAYLDISLQFVTA